MTEGYILGGSVIALGSEASSAAEAVLEVSRKYRSDAAFRARCDSSGLDVCRENDLPVSGDVKEVRFIAESGNEFHFVMPLNANRELDHSELSSESGSSNVGSVSSVGSAGTASSLISCLGCAGTTSSVGTASTANV